MEDDTLRKLQLVEFEILCEVDKLCKKNKIKFFLIGGTLLGAVRHQGFIPWDDDIDIGMMRKEYDKFLVAAQKDLSNKYIIQNKETDKRVMPSFTKIRKIGTLFIEKETQKSKINKGIFIDVFPLDNIPQKDNFILEIEYKIFKFFQIVTLYKNKYRGYKSKLIKAIACIFSILPFFLINRISYYLMTKYNKKETEYVTSYSSGYGYKRQRMLKKEIYGDGIEITFEGKSFLAPTDYSAYLKQLYGNYMQMPPEEKRTSHTKKENVFFCLEENKDKKI